LAYGQATPIRIFRRFSLLAISLLLSKKKSGEFPRSDESHARCLFAICDRVQANGKGLSLDTASA
jgi:hypothetical protein